MNDMPYLDPSMKMDTAEPSNFSLITLEDMNNSDGFDTSFIPKLFIENTPTSEAEPNLEREYLS